MISGFTAPYIYMSYVAAVVVQNSVSYNNAQGAGIIFPGIAGALDISGCPEVQVEVDVAATVKVWDYTDGEYVKVQAQVCTGGSCVMHTVLDFVSRSITQSAQAQLQQGSLYWDKNGDGWGCGVPYAPNLGAEDNILNLQGVIPDHTCNATTKELI